VPSLTVGLLTLLPWRLKRPAALIVASLDELLHHFALHLLTRRPGRNSLTVSKNFVVESRDQSGAGFNG